MSVKFRVMITHKDMVDFQLYHSRKKFARIVGDVFIVGCVAVSIWCATKYMISDSMMLMMCALIMYFFPRYQLKAKAKIQLRQEMFQREVEYEFDQKGVSIRQGDTQVEHEWSAVEKVVSTRRSVLFYMSRVRAIIFPKRCIGEQYDDFVKLIHENMPAEKVKLR